MAQFTTSDGLRLHYDRQGDGLPLLCLPGLTRNTADFDYVLPYLSGCDVIRMDMRGRGQSDRDPDWQNYTLEVECRDILELLGHLGLAQTAILGTSRGGLQAMALAAAGAKDRLLGVALNDVGPELAPEGIAVIMQYLGLKPAAPSIEAAAGAMAHVFAEFEDVPQARWLTEARKAFIETPQGLELAYDPHLRDAVLAGGEVPDLWPLFDALDGLPLALIWGLNSSLLKAPTVQHMRTRRPDMTLAEVPGRGHVPFLDEPESIAALRTWLEAMR